MLSLKERLRTILMNAGFDFCGFTDAAPLPEWQKAIFRNYIEKKHHAEMRYMENHFEKRMHPSLLVEGAKSIIVVAVNYFQQHTQAASYRIAKYAYGKDYHDVIKRMLAKTVQQIPELQQDPILRILVDSAPLPEHFLAMKAGIGFIGKNNSLIIPQKGAFFFLAEIVTSLVLPPDSPFPNNFCGTCTRCIDACPTKALEKPFTLDARRCISYLTIEDKNIDSDISLIKKSDKRWIFGCDECLAACPWNHFSEQTKIADFQPDETFLNMSDSDWATLNEENFQRYFKKSPLQRAGFAKIKKNINTYNESCEK